MNKGKYIVLEGPEGVGKSTQLQELSRRLQAAGLPVRIFREPDSQSDLTARAVRQLTQDPRYPMNTNTEVLLYNAARSQSLQVIRNSVEQGIICLVDRNYLTTLAIQYYGRGDVPDYDTINRIITFAVNGIEPDLCLVLDAPVQTLKERMKHRPQGERFDNLDEAFLERVRAGYLWEAKQRGLPVIFANEDTDTVAETIWKHVSDTLASRNKSKVGAEASNEPVSVKAILEEKRQTAGDDSEPYVEKNDGKTTITEAGKAYLADAVTSTDGDVYAFTEKLSPVTVAAAMARLSRRADDMRITILDEFAGKLGKDEQLLQRVITAYGDDSVQQLAGMHVVVENASNLLTKKLEWGRLAAYLEQSTRYIYFDQKDSDGKYRYYVPKTFDTKIRKQYCQAMDAIFDLYSQMVHELTDHLQAKSSVPEAERDGAWKSAIRAQACDAIRPVLPVATTSTVGIYASGQALESLIMHLLSDEMPESRDTGTAMLVQARQVIPVLFERADKPDRGGAMIAYRANTAQAIADLTKEMLPETHAAGTTDAITLVDVWPKSELAIVPDILYEHSMLPRKDIEKEVASWSYDKKAGVLQAYMGERLNRRQKPGRALENIHYKWDILCDYGIFRDLQRHRMVEDLAWQHLTPRYGYDIPELVEQAGLSDHFEKCFDLSLALYSLLQQGGYELEAQYATLLGHKMRWKISYNAREAFHFHELRTSPQGHPGYRKLVLDMHEKVAEIHPLLAEAMKFVNRDEDPELTRLAAERYTQYKLDQLDKK